MMFAIYFSNQSRRFLKKCDVRLRERLLGKIRLLRKEPVPHNAVRVIGEKRSFRIRIGDYRVLYEVSWDKNELLIVAIDKRPRVYK